MNKPVVSPNSNDLIYLDFAASTPLDPRVWEAMEPWCFQNFGNPANRLHLAGERAEAALGESRSLLAELLNVAFEEIIFTSSATESNNLILRGLCDHPKRKRHKILYGATEHSSIASTCIALEETHGITTLPLPVDEHGHILFEEAQKLVDNDTLCVCVMDVNNETGIAQPRLAELAQLAHAHGALLHIDTVQGFVRGPRTFCNGVDFDTATLSSGKAYGPKGVAALVIKNRFPKILLLPQHTGGGQEFGIRSGTVNIPGVVGFVRACQLEHQEHSQRRQHYANLERGFLDELERASVLPYKIFQTPSKVPGILTMNFSGVNAMKLIEESRIVCVSVGSACKTLQATASHVLLAMGIELDEALASFRISFGLPNTEDEVKRAARLLAVTAEAVKKFSASF